MTEARWLDADQQAAWRALILTTRLLDDALDRQLQRDAGLPHAYYEILVRLSEATEQRMRMVDLARTLRYSQSRLTHAVAALERDGRVKRVACTSDRRGQEAVLTPVGLDALRAHLTKAAGWRGTEGGTFSARRRHLEALARAAARLAAAASQLETRAPLELVAEELRLAHDALGELTGRVSSDELLGRIFASFCIGK